ncbi:hypothetical protein BCR41DRAFT_374606 [Lobosporangium transversale]|uniref:Uncharacterized protein n=1 Tax=Lobosporangium transversale TaxID=64571 RepID=A0A1Y2GA32_9FUNG|nr:hypothetical protein BCR41DRAFT_374606 [Lobosporangium transversale]ORZ05179.1 hypothetical protein BCR41DRAFT_374606 [Lobosporangium transversale]|eukprot:XP_021876954.1 hypothetical protein BCR41DRAFT_374606 [Lobosporangium transversale]
MFWMYLYERINSEGVKYTNCCCFTELMPILVLNYENSLVIRSSSRPKDPISGSTALGYSRTVRLSTALKDIPPAKHQGYCCISIAVHDTIIWPLSLFSRFVGLIMIFTSHLCKVLKRIRRHISLSKASLKSRNKSDVFKPFGLYMLHQ